MDSRDTGGAAGQGSEPAELRVLVVDDEADIRTLVGHALARDRRMTVRIAGSGREALAILDEWTPDCILLDSSMPGMRGEMLIIALHASPQRASIPVIMLTANATHDDAARYAGLGAAGLIAKPFDAIALAENIRATFATWVAASVGR